MEIYLNLTGDTDGIEITEDGKASFKQNLLTLGMSWWKSPLKLMGTHVFPAFFVYFSG